MQGQVTTIRMPKIWNVRAKLLSYVILAIIDGFVGRIDNEHFTNTIQSSWVLGADAFCQKSGSETVFQLMLR